MIGGLFLPWAGLREQGSFMRNIRLTLQYLGTSFHGWQIQPQGITIQALLKQLLEKLLHESITVLGAGRTDSGVHALGQVAHFKTTHPMDLPTLHRALNAQLPPAVAVTNVEEVPLSFHSTRDALEKTYVYFLLHSQQKIPFLEKLTWRRFGSWDPQAVRECLQQIEGLHDFSAFRGSDSKTKTSEREILQARLVWLPFEDLKKVFEIFLGKPVQSVPPWEQLFQDPVEDVPGLWIFSFRGKGFLKHMVRNLVGTLVDVGEGKRSSGQFREIFASKDRRLAGITAPARGLFLFQVKY